MTDRELMQEALYALTYVGDAKEIYSDTIESLRARLAQPEREWQGLTEDDALQLLPVMPYEYEVDVEMILEFASAIEAKLKEKNGTS